MELRELVELRRSARTGETRRIREAAGVSMADLAAACGVTESTMQRWETGHTRPTRENAETYARLLAELAEIVSAA